MGCHVRLRSLSPPVVGRGARAETSSATVHGRGRSTPMHLADRAPPRTEIACFVYGVADVLICGNRQSEFDLAGTIGDERDRLR